MWHNQSKKNTMKMGENVSVVDDYWKKCKEENSQVTHIGYLE